MIYVIIPAFNEQDTITRCINSIINQTLDHWTIVVVNDGSTDNTSAVIQSIGDKRIHVVDMEVNRGVATALNIGLYYAKNHLAGGSFSDDDMIVRMDADDVMVPERLAIQQEVFNNNPDVDVCHGGMILKDGSQTVVVETSQEAYESMLFFNPISHPTVAFRGSIANTVKYNPKYKGAEDYFLWATMMNTGVVFHGVNIPLVYYLGGNQSATPKVLGAIIDEVLSFYGIQANGAKWASNLSAGKHTWYSSRLLQSVLDKCKDKGLAPEGVFHKYARTLAANVKDRDQKELKFSRQ